MKQFLAIYTGTPSSLERSKWNSMDEAKRKETERAGIAAWGAWMKNHEKSVVVAGGPLQHTAVLHRLVVHELRLLLPHLLLQAVPHLHQLQLPLRDLLPEPAVLLLLQPVPAGLLGP